MMTQVLLATYPDVFAAGSAFAGVPATCFATTLPRRAPARRRRGTATAPAVAWCGPASSGVTSARAAYPGYTGRPAAGAAVARVAGHHAQLRELRRGDQAVDQRAGRQRDARRRPTTPRAARSGPATAPRATGRPSRRSACQNVGHNLPVDAAAAIHFFGLDSTTTPQPTTPAPTTPAPTTPAPTTPRPPRRHPRPRRPARRPRSRARVTYTVNQWNTGFTANITVRSERGAQRVDADLDVAVGPDRDAGVELGHHPDRVVRHRRRTRRGTARSRRAARSSSASTARTRAPTRAPTSFVLNGAPCSRG